MKSKTRFIGIVALTLTGLTVAQELMVLIQKYIDSGRSTLGAKQTNDIS